MAAIHGGVCDRTWCAAQRSEQPCTCNSQARDGNPTPLASDREGRREGLCLQRARAPLPGAGRKARAGDSALTLGEQALGTAESSEGRRGPWVPRPSG